MLEIRKTEQKPVVVIRAASGHELSNEEKRKLARIEDDAQRNRIEVIKVNNEVLQIDPLNKEVRIDLGDLATKSKIRDIDTEDLFIIKCELDEAILKELKEEKEE
jgi:hypothetical protein